MDHGEPRTGTPKSTYQQDDDNILDMFIIIETCRGRPYKYLATGTYSFRSAHITLQITASSQSHPNVQSPLTTALIVDMEFSGKKSWDGHTGCFGEYRLVAL